MLYLSPKPKTNISQLSILEGRISNIEFSLKGVSSWTKQHNIYLSNLLSENKKINDVMRFSFDLRELVNQLNLQRINANEYKYPFDRQSGILDDNTKILLEEIEPKIRSICQGTEKQEDTYKCALVKEQKTIIEGEITNIKNLFKETSSLIGKVRILESQKIRKKDIILVEKVPPRTIKPSNEKSSMDKDKEWLFNADISIKQVKIIISELNKSPRNDRIMTQVKTLFSEIQAFNQKYDQIARNIKSRESRLQSNLVNLDVDLNSSKDDSITLEDLSGAISKTQKYSFKLLSQIESDLTNLTSQLRTKKYELVELKRLNSTTLFFDSDSLANQNLQEIKNLSTKIESEIQVMVKIQDELKKDSTNYRKEIGGLVSLGEDLRSRNDQIIQSMEIAILRSTLQLSVIVLLPTFILFMFLMRQSRKLIVNRIRSIENDSAVPELITIIENTNEFQDVRIFAIDILYNKLYLPTQDEISLIKEKVNNLASSPLRENKKIASRLREIAVALELRLTESRKVI